MDSRRWPVRGGGRAGGALLTLAAVLGLLALVAVASRGGASFGSDGGVRRPSHTVIDTLLSLYIVVLFVGGVLFVVLLLTHKESAFERRLRKRENRNRNLLALVLFVGLLALVVRFAGGNAGGEDEALPRPADGDGLSVGTGALADAYDPEFAYLPVFVVVGLGTLAAVAFVLAERARRKALPPRPDAALFEALVDVLDESLDDLRAERDPRRAVVAAYARMEKALAAYGLPRNAAEAPAEYLDRVLSGIDVPPDAIRRLTALFERAKFSQHDVDANMKEQAIDALQIAREELHLAHERELADAEEALAEARERANR